MTRESATPTTIEHRVGPTGQLSVKLVDWEVELIAGPGELVRVQDGDGRELPDDLEVERGPTSLSIRQPSRFGGLGIVVGTRRGGRRLRIDVPTHVEANVQTASGAIASTGLRGEQHLRTAAGDLRLDAASGEATTETVSGDISVNVEGSIGLAVKTVSGDVAVEGGRVERLRLTTTSGDVRLTSDLGPGPHAIATVSGDAILLSNRGLRITAVTVAGDLRSDLPHTSQGGPGRRSLVIGDGAADLQFRSVSGDLRVMDPAVAGNGSLPVVATPPLPPEPPTPPTPPTPPAPVSTAEPVAAEAADAADETRLEILRALEAGEIDVAEATDRLAGLDGSTDD